MSRVFILIAVLLAITLLVVWVASGNGQGLGTQQGSASLAYSIALVVLATSSLVLGWRGSGSQALRYAFIWKIGRAHV